MVNAFALFVAVIYLTVAVVVLVLFLGLLRRGWGRFRALPYEPVVDPYEPDPVVVTGPLRLAAVVAIIWAVAHLLAVGWFLATGAGLGAYGVARSAASVALAGYVMLAAALTGLGGLVLIRAVAGGRKMVSWGQFLFVVAGLWSIAFCLRLPTNRNTPDELKAIGYPLATLLVVHVLIDAFVGTLAQRVGRPERPAQKEAVLAQPELLGDWDVMAGPPSG